MWLSFIRSTVPSRPGKALETTIRDRAAQSAVITSFPVPTWPGEVQTLSAASFSSAHSASACRRSVASAPMLTRRICFPFSTAGVR